MTIPIGEADWLALFGQYMIKSTFVLSLALLAGALLRKRSASLRHLILSLFLIGLLLFPVFSFFPVGWETSLLPSGTPGNTHYLGLSSQELLGEEFLAIGVVAKNKDLESVNSTHVEFPPLSREPSPPAKGTRLWKNTLLITWLAGFIVLLSRLGLGLFGAFRLTRSARVLGDPPWKVLLERFLAAIHLKRKICLKSHGEIAIPLTWGLVRPVILIPADHENWTEDQRSSALLHELSHVKRADFLVMLLVRLSLALFWLNPLSWFAFRMLKSEQEKACDELVLKTGIKPSTYAANLLLFKRATIFSWNPSVALLGILSRSQLNERLVAILKQKMTVKEVKMKTKIMLALSVILAVALIGMARPSAALSENATDSVTIAAASKGASNSAMVAESNQATEPKPAKEAEKQEEQKKIKPEKKAPIEITIKQGDKIKKIVVDKPTTIKAGPEGTIIITTSEGKEIKVVKERQVGVEIDEPDLEDFYVHAEPHVEVITPGIDSEKKVHVVIEPMKHEKTHLIGITEDWEHDVQEQLSEIREELKQIKEGKLEIQELEKSLDELEVELKKLGEKPKSFTVIREKGSDKTVRKVLIDEDAKKNIFTVTVEKEGGITIICTIRRTEKSRETYEKAVERVRKELPEGYTLEPEFVEKSGTMVFKIKGPEGKEAPEKLVQKLVDVIKEELEL